MPRFTNYEDLIVAKRRGDEVTAADVRYVLACHEDGAMAGGEEYAEQFMAEVEAALIAEGLL